MVVPVWPLAQNLYPLSSHESTGAQGTCAGQGARDATEHQNKDHNKEEPPPVAGNLVGGGSLVLGRSTVTACAFVQTLLALAKV